MELKNYHIVGAIALCIFLIAASMALLPRYNVWRLELSGKAKLKEAEWSRMVVIEEASAKKEAAQHLATRRRSGRVLPLRTRSSGKASRTTNPICATCGFRASTTGSLRPSTSPRKRIFQS